VADHVEDWCLLPALAPDDEREQGCGTMVEDECRVSRMFEGESLNKKLENNGPRSDRMALFISETCRKA